MITKQKVLSWGPCPEYTPAVIDMLLDGREGLTVLEVVELNIPPEDRIWVLIHPGVLSSDILDAWLLMIVERAVRRYALSCDIPEVEDWAGNWLAGEDRSEEAAWATSAAAWATSAAADAAIRAAAATTSAAAWAAARASAVAAAWAAARAAAAAVDAAAWASAAAAVERQQQISDLLSIIYSNPGDF